MDLIKAVPKTKGPVEIDNPGFDAAVSDVQSGHAQGMITQDDSNRCSESTFGF